MSEEPLKGIARQPTEDEMFYRQWGYETVKANISTANDVLRLLITVNVALLGGGAAFLHESTIAEGVRIVLLVSFFIALTIALIGVYPKESKIDARIPSDVKQHKDAVLQRKRLFLKLGSGFTLAGLLASIFAVTGLRVCF
ncbi:hypothetical protein [Halopseudomonas bauzanensis]|uniref:hypothetical protein n=1 Tax=Halopseudomonas bauzanensis TaxID=653930 RepID=UPI00115FB35B|nr:hypothetical protein [Halopseudomonas bauzanensis]